MEEAQTDMAQSDRSAQAILSHLDSFSLNRHLLSDPTVRAFRDLVSSVASGSKDPYSPVGDLAYRLLRATADRPMAEGLSLWQNHLVNAFLSGPWPDPIAMVSDTPLAEEFHRSDLRHLLELMRISPSVIESLIGQSAQAYTPLPCLFDPSKGTIGSPGGDGVTAQRSPVTELRQRLLSDMVLPGLDLPTLDSTVSRIRSELGYGILSLTHVFTYRPDAGLTPVLDPDPVSLDDLLLYDRQKQAITANTERLARGLPASNILLYGRRGTGKSSMVKAVARDMALSGVSLVQLAREELCHLPSLTELLKTGNRRFIVFVDDLSFDESERGFREIKAAIEGGVRIQPDNLVIYATSNRRHLVEERFSDGDEVRGQDTVHEKLSLADRFAMTILFPSPDKETYLSIARGLALKYGAEVEDSEFDSEALEWAALHNGFSCRTARQFALSVAPRSTAQRSAAPRRPE